MRPRFLFGVGILGLALLLVGVPSVESQFRKGGGGGGFPGGGGPGGGGPGGGFGGPGGGDPAKLFDMLSKGRGFFLINETRMLRDPLTKWAEENRITNGQVTRDQFITFMKSRETVLRSPTGPGPTPPGPPGTTAPAPDNKERMEALNGWAESEFKRFDRNDDSYLNMDEAPDALRGDFRRWDNNGDNLISMNEFKAYFTARFSGGARGEREANPIITIIEEEELDKRPVVFRAGKLPKDIPSWFQELDTDKDGQVSLYEWRKGSKDLDEFRNYDFNDDGLIVPEEAMQQRTIASAGNGGSGGEASARPEGGRFGGGGFGGGGFGGGFGGFGKGPKGGGGGKKFEFKRPP